MRSVEQGSLSPKLAEKRNETEAVYRTRQSVEQGGLSTKAVFQKLLSSSVLSGSDTLSDSLTEISELTGYQEYQISEISGPIFCFTGSIRRLFFVLRGPSDANFLFYGVHPAQIFCFTGSIRRQLFSRWCPSGVRVGMTRPSRLDETYLKNESRSVHKPRLHKP